MKKKSIALLMAVVMLFGVAVGGTIAWLTAEATEVVNTFVSGNIAIELDEADVNIETTTDNVTTYTYTEYVKENAKVDGIANADRVKANKYDVVPGSTYSKDPRVTVKANSEKCYLFVKFEEIGNPSTYYTYAPNWTGWTPLGETTYPGIYYREVDTNAADQSWYLLTGNDTYVAGYISVKDNVTLTNMSAAAAAELKWTAYAIQFANFDNAEAAWTQLRTEYSIS